MNRIISITVNQSITMMRNEYHIEERQKNGNKIYYAVIKEGENELKAKRKKIEINGKDIDLLINALKEIEIKICPDYIFGLDGMTTTITIEQGFNKATYQWWGEIPEQWKALDKIFAFFDDIKKK